MYPCLQRGKPDTEEGGAMSCVQSFKTKIISLLAQDATGCANPGPFFGRKFSASCVCEEKVEKCESGCWKKGKSSMISPLAEHRDMGYLSCHFSKEPQGGRLES